MYFEVNHVTQGRYFSKCAIVFVIRAEASAPDDDYLSIPV